MIIVTGAKGQLGGDVCRLLKEKKIEYIGIDKDEVDITDKKATEDFFSDKKIDALIHCAAYTAVDKAEQEKELCIKINAEGTKNLAQECSKKNALMIYVSTDYVFDGKGDSPFLPDDRKNPLSVYGKSKSDGEDFVREICKKHFIVRTSWVFGEENRNFIHTMLRLSETKKELNVVDDQIGSPTYSKDLAELLVSMTESDKYGIYHGTNEGFCSWYELASKVFEIRRIDIKVNPVSSDEFPTAAVRPHNSRLSKDCLEEAGFDSLPCWQNAVERYLKNI